MGQPVSLMTFGTVLLATWGEPTVADAVAVGDAIDALVLQAVADGLPGVYVVDDATNMVGFPDQAMRTEIAARISAIEAANPGIYKGATFIAKSAAIKYIFSLVRLLIKNTHSLDPVSSHLAALSMLEQKMAHDGVPFPPGLADELTARHNS